MDSKINDNKNNMGTINKDSETNIRTQHNRNGSVYTKSEIQNNNKNITIHLTQSRIICEDHSTNSDLDGKINPATKDFPILRYRIFSFFEYFKAQVAFYVIIVLKFSKNPSGTLTLVVNKSALQIFKRIVVVAHVAHISTVQY